MTITFTAFLLAYTGLGNGLRWVWGGMNLPPEPVRQLVSVHQFQHDGRWPTDRHIASFPAPDCAHVGDAQKPGQLGLSKPGVCADGFDFSGGHCVSSKGRRARSRSGSAANPVFCTHPGSVARKALLPVLWLLRSVPSSGRLRKPGCTPDQGCDRACSGRRSRPCLLQQELRAGLSALHVSVEAARHARQAITVPRNQNHEAVRVLADGGGEAALSDCGHCSGSLSVGHCPVAVPSLCGHNVLPSSGILRGNSLFCRSGDRQ